MKPNLTLAARLTLLFIIFALAIIGGVGWLSYASGRDSLHATTVSELQATAIEKQAALNAWVEDRQAVVASLSTSPSVREDLAAYAAATPGSAEGQSAHSRLVAELQGYTAQRQFLALLVIGPADGQVIAATNIAEEGKFREDQPYFINGKNGPYVQNLYYSTALQAPAMTVSAPILGSDGGLLGVLAGRLNLEEMNTIINRRSGLRRSDEAFLVNTSQLFVTQPRLTPNQAVLQRGVHSEDVNRCLDRNSGVISALDYRGVPALVAYRWLPERGLCLIVKMDEAEALAPVRAFGGTITLVGGLTLLVAFFLAIGLARSITRPVLALQTGADRIAQGELTLQLPESASGELGALARAFNRMATALAEKEAQLRGHAAELERRVAERTAALSESEERYRGLADNALVGVYRTTLAGEILYVNDALAKMMEFESREAMRAANVLTRYRDPASRQALLTALRASGKVDNVELEVLTKNNRPRYVLLSATLEGGFLSGMIVDITERKQAEETLVTSETRYRRLFESAQDGILILDGETGMIVDVNPFLLELLGFRREQFLEKKIWELGLFKDIAANQEAFVELLRKEYIRFENLPLETSAGLRIEVEFVSYVYQMNHQKLIQCNIRNITDRVKAEMEIRRVNVELEQRVAQRTIQLEVANKELQSFAYSVSHDLRAPLRGIDGFSQALLNKFSGQLGEEGEHYLARVRENTQRMGRLIDDLLTLSRVSRQEMSRQPVDLMALANEIATMLGDSDPQRKVHFKITGQVTVEGDAGLLRVILQNLLENAWKFTSKRELAEIEVGFNVHEEQVFYVRDNGVGFDMQYADKLFGAFQRLHSVQEFPGTGIGLATVQRVVHRHGGRIWAEAMLDRGATFYFTLGANS